MIDRATVSQLETLYRQREELQRVKDELQHNFWVGVMHESFGHGHRTRLGNRLLVAVGGDQALMDVFHSAAVAKIDAMQRDLDTEIEKLGGLS